MKGISKSQVSRLCADIDERVGAFLNRPIEGDWPAVKTFTATISNAPASVDLLAKYVSRLVLSHAGFHSGARTTDPRKRPSVRDR